MIEDTETELPPRKKKLQPKWKNAPTKADLYNDLKSAESGQEDFRVKLLEWEETRNGGKEITVTGLGKSKARPKVVRKQNEWKYPALEDPFLSTSDLYKIAPATGMDIAAAEQNEQILNYQWNTKVQKTKLVSDIVRTVVDEGTVIVKTGWDVATKIVEQEVEQPKYASPEQSIQLMQMAVEQGRMSPEQAQAMLETGEPLQIGVETVIEEVEVLTKNQPTYEVCINANVTVDPTCDGVAADAMFVIHEYDTNYADLKAEEHSSDENGEEYGIYHNLDYITSNSSEEYDEALTDESNNFEFKDKTRKRMRAYEYWGYWDIQGDGVLVGIVATWVNNTLIRLEENPFPHGRLPFSIATYMPVKKSVHGEPDAELLKENQDTIGNMTRAIQDTTTKMAAGQEFIDENFFPSPSVKNQYEKGNTVYYRTGFRPKDAIYKNEVQQIGSTPFDVISWQTADANELTGTKPFGNGNEGVLGGSKQDKDAMDATAKRELSILRRLSDMLFLDMARMTIAMNQAWLSEEEVIRITDKEFVTIKRDDLQGDFDLRIKISTPERDADQANKIMKLMQTNAANMDPAIAKLHYIEMAELWKLEKLAKAVKEQEPAPDPRAEEMAALQIEEQKLKNAILMKELDDLESKIAERISRAKGNTNDAELTVAKTNQANAIAGKLESETDILDSSFLYTQEGLKRQHEIEDQEYKVEARAAEKDKDRQASVEDQEYATAAKAFEIAGQRAAAKTVNEV